MDHFKRKFFKKNIKLGVHLHLLIIFKQAPPFYNKKKLKKNVVKVDDLNNNVFI
jgi:hypothetical protein